MKLLVLSESANHVSCRYRVQAFEPALRRAGCEVVARPLTGEGAGFFAILREAMLSDVVLIQRRLLALPKLRLLRQCARRLIYDVDDALFLRDNNAVKPAESWRRRNRFQAMVAACDAVIAGNEYLAACATRWSQRGRVTCIPTCVDPEAYRPATHRRRRAGLRLAWIGSRSTLTSLRAIGSALNDAGARLPGLELHVICDQPPSLPGVPVMLHPWSKSSEARDLAACDAGISWLPNHPWSRGKCGLKVLQYMAAGLPVIVNGLGVHGQIVCDGVNGLVVRRPDDLYKALNLLAGDPELRRQMGHAGRQCVERHYAVQHWSGVFVQILLSVAERGTSRKAS